MTTILIAAMGAAFLRQLTKLYWRHLKQKRANSPIHLTLRNGIHQPWGWMEKTEHYGGYVALAYCAFLVVALTITFAR